MIYLPVKEIECLMALVKILHVVYTQIENRHQLISGKINHLQINVQYGYLPGGFMHPGACFCGASQSLLFC